MTSAAPEQAELDRVFETLYDRHRAAVHSFLYGLTRSRDDADDLTQETFVKAYRALPRTDLAQLNPVAWLHRIAYNAAMDLFRRRRLIAWLPLAAWQADAPRQAAVELPDLDQEEAVRQVLQQLPPDQRACLLLRDQQGYSYAEIARITGASLGAVRMRILRGRETFRRLWCARYPEASR